METDRENKKESWCARHPLAGAIVVSVVSCAIVGIASIGSAMWLYTHLLAKDIAINIKEIEAVKADLKVIEVKVEGHGRDFALINGNLDAKQGSIDGLRERISNYERNNTELSKAIENLTRETAVVAALFTKFEEGMTEFKREMKDAVKEIRTAKNSP